MHVSEDVGKLLSSPHLEKLLNMASAEKGDPDDPKDVAQLRKWIKGIEVTVVSSEETTADADTDSDNDTDAQPDVDESALDSSGVSDNSSDVASGNGNSTVESFKYAESMPPLISYETSLPKVS